MIFLLLRNDFLGSPFWQSRDRIFFRLGIVYPGTLEYNQAMEFKGQNILSTRQFDKKGLEELFERAMEMEKIVKRQRGRDDCYERINRKRSGDSEKKGKGFSKLFDGEILATLFFEPSTRTRFSFETAFLRLGGKVISGADMISNSSITKGETLYDTGKVVSQLADLIVMRHPLAGSVEELARGANPGWCGGKNSQSSQVINAEKGGVPVINAGDGPNQHPTQALLDVYTIWKEFDGRLDGLTVGMIGDLKYGRVPHSQCDLLRHWKVKFIFVSPKALAMPSDVKESLSASKREFFETEKLEKVIGRMDVICATRIQAERFKSAKEAERYEGVYVIDRKMMVRAKKSAILMHPLPRVSEVAVEVDSDPRAKYFKQVRNGLAVRMALLAMVMGR
jgi:aspartate carbamoyltransferase